MAILSLGIASASEDIGQGDTVSIEDDAISLQREMITQDDEIGLEDDEIIDDEDNSHYNAINIEDEGISPNDKEKISSGSQEILQDKSYNDGEFYINVKENYTQDKTNWDKQYLIYLVSYSNKNGTFKVLIDDAEKGSFNITDGNFTIEENGETYKRMNRFVYPTELDELDCGTYNLKVKFESEELNATFIDTPINIREKEDFDIVLYNPYYCNKDYWPTSSFITITSNHYNNGTFVIYVNGSAKITYIVDDGQFEEIEGCSNRSRYIPASDLFEDYGSYNIQINFTENGVERTFKDEDVITAEFEPTTNPKLDLYLDLYTLYVPADNRIRIYLPKEATGSLTVSYNGFNYPVSYSKGYGECNIPCHELNHLGANMITVNYEGDDFGILTNNITCTVVPKIVAPIYVSLGEEFAITMSTHNWASGKFNVYEYDNGEKGSLIASCDLRESPSSSNSSASVRLSSKKLGLNKYYLEFDYPGGDYPIIKDIYIIENSENITVTVPSELESGNDLTVNFTAPASPFNFVYISVDGGKYEFSSLENGEVIKVFSGLSDGYHKVKIEYNGGQYSNGYLIGDVYSNTFTVNIGEKTTVSASDFIGTYNYGNKLTAILKDNDNNPLAGKTLALNVNGANYTATTDDSGKASFTINLKAGNYLGNIIFAGSSGYFASNKTVNIIVNKSTTKLTAPQISTVYNVAKYLVITLKDGKNRILSGKAITIKLNGKTYKRTSDKNGQVKLSVNLPAKTYTAYINFAGDSNYIKSGVNAKVIVKKANPRIIATNKAFKVKTKVKKITATLKDNKGRIMKNTLLTLTISGKKYSIRTNSKGIATFKVSLNKKGTFKAYINFKANSNYNAVKKAISVKIQ